MVSVKQQGNVYDFRGLKSDMDKLDPNIIKNGSTFYCMDTIDVYMYDESTKQWLFQTKAVGGVPSGSPIWY